ncbi:MAG: FHA domain-containing protein [Lentisphaeria bacterium]|nr:FHA domain-containing protein [Lentisphaeria bacterium]
MIRYIVYISRERVHEGELLPGEHIAGRSHSADIRLSEPDISGRHLKLEVVGGEAFAENLSSHGTRRKGEPLTERVRLEDGDILQLGGKLEIHFEISAPQAPSGSEMKTVIPGQEDPQSPGEATRVPAASPAGDAPREVSAPAPEGETVKEPSPDASGASDVVKTDVMHTRLASMEEMEQLRHADRKRSTGKMFRYVVGVVAAFGALIFFYTLKSEPPEPNLTWPKDRDGNFLGAFTDPGSGGHASGGFSLAYPSIKGKTSVRTAPGQITVTTRIGRDASVPLRILFVERRSEKFLHMTRQAVFSSMLRELQKQEQHWSLSQISDVFFIGSENGIPCLSVEFRREADRGSWFGEILFFRTGDRAYLRLAEAPVSERARAQNFISGTPLVKFSQKYIHEHWEGDPEYRGGADSSAMMDEVAKSLSKQVPFEWTGSCRLLRRVLMNSLKTGDQRLKNDALAQLRRLRSMQTVWYNGKKISFSAAGLNDDRQQENAIWELCKMVFSSPDDLRYFTLRRNVWE